MKIGTIIFSIVIILIVLEGIQFWTRFRIGKELAEKATAFMREDKGASYQVLFVGDSTAVGTGSARSADSLAGRFFVDFPSISIQNVGENGARLKRVGEQLAELGNTHFNLVVIQAGGNDILRFTKADDIKKGIENAVLRARELGDFVVILHSGNIGAAPLFPRPLSWIYTSRTRALRDVYREIAKRYDVSYVDLFRERGDDIFLTDLARYYAPDMFHPSSEGYQFWYDLFKETLERDGVQLP